MKLAHLIPLEPNGYIFSRQTGLGSFLGGIDLFLQVKLSFTGNVSCCHSGIF